MRRSLLAKHERCVYRGIIPEANVPQNMEDYMEFRIGRDGWLEGITFCLANDKKRDRVMLQYVKDFTVLGAVSKFKLVETFIKHLFNERESEFVFNIWEGVAECGHLCMMSYLNKMRIVNGKYPSRDMSYRFLDSSARGGSLRGMVFALRLTENGLYGSEALQFAAQNGHTRAMKLLRRWERDGKIYFGVQAHRDAFSEASVTGNLNCLRLLKKWGASNFYYAIVNAVCGNYVRDHKCVAILNQLEKWMKKLGQVVPYDKILAEATHSKLPSAIKWVLERI